MPQASAYPTDTLERTDYILGTTAAGAVKRFSASALRERLTAARTYYVRTDGSNSNNGLANTSGGAFLTIQYAMDYVCDAVDSGSVYIPTIQVGAGTYAESVEIKRLSGYHGIHLVGDLTTPSNVVITGGVASYDAEFLIGGFKITNAAGAGLLLVGNNTAANTQNMEYGTCVSGDIYLQSGALWYPLTGWTKTGTSPTHISLHSSARVDGTNANGQTVTLTGTPAFATAFITAEEGSIARLLGLTFSGSATGVRYTCTLNSVINTNGGGASYFPGNSAGSTATGGQYA